MPFDLTPLLVVGISSRALFDLEEEDRIFRKLGLPSYRIVQLEYENDLLDPGTAFPLVKRLLALNEHGERRVEVIVISKNHPETGLRVFKSIRHHGLDISRAAFTGGEPLNRYLEAFKIDLFLSRSRDDVQAAIDGGFAAAELYNPPADLDWETEELRIAFDADAVLFSDESETIYQQEGLEAFHKHEDLNAETPLEAGPLGNLLRKLSALRNQFDPNRPPVRIGIVTARNSPAHERVIKTLRNWGVEVDAAFFLGGLSKDSILKAFGAHIFFDDQEGHLALASLMVPSALVPYHSNSPLRSLPTAHASAEAAEPAMPAGSAELTEPTAPAEIKA
jgi:5'-nucleotidase